MRSILLVATFGLAVLAAPLARADTFLGEDGEAQDKGGGEAGPASKKKKKKKKAKPQPVAATAEEETTVPHSEAASEGGEDAGGQAMPLVFSGALGSGAGYISGQITVGYYFNKFIGIDTSYYYYRFDNHDSSGQQYGPEVDLVIRATNPTIVTPYAGVGPGHSKWQRTASGKVFDASSSWTFNEFVGVDVRLTSHFGIGITRKQQTYLNDPPKGFDDHNAAEAKSSWATNIGFRMAF